MSNDLTPEVAWVYELRWEGTNEIYIGSTSKHPEVRFKGHQAQPRKCYAHLGIENAKLAWCYPYEPRHLHDRDEEIRWKQVSRDYGYTVLDDGDTHSTALRQSEESNQKRSEANKRYWACPKARRKQSEALRGKPKSEKHKRKLSVANKIAANRPEVKRKMVEAQNRYWADPEARRKQSEAAKIAMNSPETIRKQRLAKGQQFICTWPDGSVTTYLSSREAEAELGVTKTTIQNYLKGRSTPGSNKKTAHLRGCRFKYI